MLNVPVILTASTDVLGHIHPNKTFGGNAIDLCAIEMYERFGKYCYSCVAISHSIQFENLNDTQLEEEILNQLNEELALQNIAPDLESVQIIK